MTENTLKFCSNRKVCNTDDLRSKVLETENVILTLAVTYFSFTVLVAKKLFQYFSVQRSKELIRNMTRRNYVLDLDLKINLFKNFDTFDVKLQMYLNFSITFNFKTYTKKY